MTIVNVVTWALLRTQTQREGLRWREFIGADFRKPFVKQDLMASLLVLLLSAPIAMVPNIGLATLLYGDSETVLQLFIQPLPRSIAFASLILMPITTGLVELPTYFAYVMPRLARRWSNHHSALLVSALLLAAQHITLPLIMDVRFVIWRFGMFIPFAVLLGFVLRRRPRLLPYLMFLHAVIDFTVVLMVWQVSLV